MFDTLKLLLKKSLPEFSHDRFMEFLQSNYGQIVVTIVQIVFSSDVNQALSQNDEECESALRSVNQLIISKLDILSSHVKKELAHHERNVAVSLIIILVHSRDIIYNLISSNVHSADDFQWKQQLRYHWDEHGNNCMVNHSISSFVYGYEYLGCSTRLVITPLTNRCFLTLTGALNFYLSGAPIGPAGTGKSESVKDLAKILGKHCIIFNCSEGINFKMIGRFLSGVSQSGSWVCFDEFNRIDREVLSVIAQQLHLIRTAKLAAAIRFMFEGRDIRLNLSSGIFITMNPSYAGRVELPDNLNSMFRPVSMVTPDNRHIAEIILFSNGFSEAAVLSRKLVKVYDLAKNQLSQQHHYDFGLRAIKAVLTVAGDHSINATEAINEEAVLIQAIQDSNSPKLIFEDSKIFEKFLQDVFSKTGKFFFKDVNPLEKSIGIALRHLGLQRWPSQVQKVIQLDKTLNVRHGVMLVGPTAGGKTTVRKILKRALIVKEGGHRVEADESNDDKQGNTKSAVVDMVTINPKSLSLGELYGEFDSNTAEWTDGLLSSTVRRFVSENAENKQQTNDATISPSKAKMQKIEEAALNNSVQHTRSLHQWLVLDGPVDTLWIENLNTMLDDSKLLCLANGERITMLPSMRVMFEVHSLENASPATISRCGMIYLDPSELGWEPVVRSWLRKQRELYRIPEEARDYLWDLFEKSTKPGYEFLEKYQHYRLINVPYLSVVQTTCNLLGAYMKYLAENGGFGDNVEDGKEDEEEVENDENVFDITALLFDFNKDKKKSKTKSLLQLKPDMLLPVLGKLFVFSYMWAFGGHFDCLGEEAEEIDQNAYVPNFHVEEVNIRHIFDHFLRNLFEPLEISLPQANSVLYSYYVELEKGQWVLWDHLVVSATMQLNHISSNTLINLPVNDDEQQTDHNLTLTPHTICYSFLMAFLSLNNCPVLLGGPIGVGKSILVHDVLKRLSQPDGCKITSNSLLGCVLPLYKHAVSEANSLTEMHNQKGLERLQDNLLISQVSFSALTGAQTPKAALQAKLVKRGRNVLCSKFGEKVIVFVDDLNMPVPETFGSQPPLEVLREYLDYNGFYDAKNLQWKEVYNVTLISACGLTMDTSRRNIHDRLVQKFNTICLPRPSAQSLHHIFSTQITSFLENNDFSNEVKSYRSDIISTVLGVYHKIKTTLRPAPSKSHYLFNLRDVGKVVNGLMQAHYTIIKTKDNFIELLIHEVSRVFHDRLVCENDRKYFNAVLLDQIHDFMKIRWNQDRLDNHYGIFGDFFDVNHSKNSIRIYQCLRDQKKLVHILESYHDRGRLTGKNVPEELCLFPSMCQHIVSAARVLRQPGGHLLILGIGGTGKTSAVQLAGYMEFCEFVHPAFTRTYSLNDFKEDLHKAMFKAGVHGKKLVFFIQDKNIVHESFLEVVCTVLNGANLSMFFDAETKESIAMELKAEAHAHGIADTSAATFEFFERRVQQNLHIVFSTSPSGTLFHRRCQLYPALINNCTIDYYAKWPTQALYCVAQKFLALEDHSEEDLKAISHILVQTHEDVEKMCSRFYDDTKRVYYVTPKSFLNFISLFKTTLNNRREKLNFDRDRLLNGLRKLSDTNRLVVDMKTDLVEIGPQLDKKSKDTEEIMSEILKDQEKVNKVRAVVKKEQEVTDRETKKVEAVALEATKDLDKALPQLEAATAALDSLNKYDIGEIRSYANPPIMVMTVLSAVCVILNEKPEWQTAKLLLSDPNFLKKLINYDHENVPDKIHNRLKKYTKHKDFNPLTVGKISVACKSMCSWVLALENYTNVSRVVKPKQEKCRIAQEALREARAKLHDKEAKLKKVEDQLKELEMQHEHSMTQLESLQHSKELTLKRLDRAALLIKALNSEKDRWALSLEKLGTDSQCLLSEALILAGCTSYIGPFTPSYRTSFIIDLVERIKKHKIRTIDAYDLVDVACDPVQVQAWRNSGLPHDIHSTQNALFVQHTDQWPYIIDPQQQAFKWLRGKEKASNLQIVKANDPLLIRTLENSIRLGETVIIQNATTTLDPALDPILHKNIIMRGDQGIIILGETEIAYNPAFKLYILTEDENPKFLPELCIKVCVINFIITMEGLADQMLSKIVQQENPELENELVNVLQLLVNEKFHLTELEDLSLNRLQSSKGNILDDEDLITTLDNSRNLAAGIKEKLIQSEEKESKLSEKRKIYLPLAEHGALLFFIASDLSMVDSMYQFSLQWFMDLFSKCIARSSQEDEGEIRPPSSMRSRLSEARKYSMASQLTQRKLALLYSLKENSNQTTYIRSMKEFVTEIFYKVVSYALFARHQLLFALHLTARIKIFENEKNYSNLLNRHLYEFLLRGNSLNQYAVRTLKTPDIPGSPALSERSDRTTQSQTDGVFSSVQMKAIEDLELLECFAGVTAHVTENIDRWNTFMKSVNPMDNVEKLHDPNVLSNFKPTSLTTFQKLILVKTLRPDHLVDGITLFVTEVMGKQYVTPSGFDLKDLYAESNCRTPIMFILSPGSDPASRLLKFVKEVRGSLLHLEMISLGRSQGDKALDAIKRAYTNKGSWVFLQNCHLALSFMPKLEETVRQLGDQDVTVNQNFRLWLSSKPDVNLPVSIMQSSMKVTVEPPPGVKSYLKTSFANVGGGVVTEALFEEKDIHPQWKQLLYSACFFHAVLQERKKFGSLGWNLSYDFITADLEVAVLTLQDILSSSPDIQWSALQFLTGEIIYGGRVRDSWDQRCLLALLKRFYSTDLMSTDFRYLDTPVSRIRIHRKILLPKDVDVKIQGYVAPDQDLSFFECLRMVEEFPSSDSAQIFGMGKNAMYERRREEGVKIMDDLMLMQPNAAVSHSSSSADKALIIGKINKIFKSLPTKIKILVPRKVKSAIIKRESSISQMGVLRTTRSSLDKRVSGEDKKLSEGLNTLQATVAPALEVTQESTSENEIDQKSYSSAIDTVLQQEERLYNNLLHIINTSLQALKQAVSGEALLTDDLQNIATSLMSNRVPELWKKHSYLSNKMLLEWISNLRRRVNFIRQWMESLIVNDHAVCPQPRAVWLPAMFYPQGFLMAILQNHSRRLRCSIDTLQLRFEITNESWTSSDTMTDKYVSPNPISFRSDVPVNDKEILIYGLFLDGASWNVEKKYIEECEPGRRLCPLPMLRVVAKEEKGTSQDVDVKNQSTESSSCLSGEYECPVYQTLQRRNIIGSKFDNYVIPISLPTDVETDFWILRGVAATCQTDA